jgi:hypothetical protein
MDLLSQIPMKPEDSGYQTEVAIPDLHLHSYVLLLGIAQVVLEE